MAKSIDGNMSHVISKVLELFFFNPEGVDFATTGVIIDVSELGDGSHLETLVAKMACTIGDEEALRELHMNKGHAGRTCCAVCRDLMNHRFDYASRDESGLRASDTSLEPDSRRQRTPTSPSSAC